MKTKPVRDYLKRALALFLVLIVFISAFTNTVLAAQEDNYHDPAEHWLSAGNRTNELDSNATVTKETFHCTHCRKSTKFTVWRTPEYTTDGKSAMERNVIYSDGTCIDGESTGSLMDGTPGKDAYYTGHHWTKACCDTCGEMNTNFDVLNYANGKNVYWLYDCADEFMEKLDDRVSYEYADDEYHRKITESGEYCCYCFGTHKKTSAVLEKHRTEKKIIPQMANGRFAVTEKCRDCSYEKTGYIAAKSVVADYYGTVDGQPHTVKISDLSEAGVTTQIRYGNSAESCTMTTAPSFTEAGRYNVYYEIKYTYGNVSMTENGVAYVWLDDEKQDDNKCDCGCGKDDCHCSEGDGNCGCGGDCCGKPECQEKHNYVLLEKVPPTCHSLGYSRYACVNCGKTEKRDYVNALDHQWQQVTVREADCVTDGKVLKICANCGEVEVISTPKGEHSYKTHKVEPTCTGQGYTVKECEICGDRHITEMIPAKAHSYRAIVTPATCESGGFTMHLCDGCGSSFVTDYTEPLGHKFDDGKIITDSTCSSEGVKEFRCVRCGYHKLEAVSSKGHTPGTEATCTKPQVCEKCGAVIKNALGHDYEVKVTEPTCTEMGYSTHTCKRCGESFKTDYTEAKGHKPGEWITDQKPTSESEGKRHKECTECGKVLETETIEKIYNSGTTDSHGEVTVGEYLIIVTDTDTKEPVANAYVVLGKDGSISVKLPDGRLIDYENQTTVTVLIKESRKPVEKMTIMVTDKNRNYCEEKTDSNGQVTVPDSSGITNGDGDATEGFEDEDGNRFTITVKVEDYESGKPVSDAHVNIGKTGNITVILPDGEPMDEDNRIKVTVTDQNRKPLEKKNVIVKDDEGNSESGRTDKEGKLIVPEVLRKENHRAYMKGYPDGTFRPDRRMTRGEAAAIFARLVSEKKGENVHFSESGRTKYNDVPYKSWYSGHIKYITGYGIIYGYEDGTFRPEEPVTRAEFTAMAVRFFEVVKSGNEELIEKYTDFRDVSEGYWAAEYIYDAVTYGWINGYGDGTFRGDAKITRAEVVTLLNRMLDRTADMEFISENIRKLNSYSDIHYGHWAYEAVMEASNSHNAVYDETESWVR